MKLIDLCYLHLLYIFEESLLQFLIMPMSTFQMQRGHTG